MEKSNVEEFADYEVYEVVDGKYHCLCVCKELSVANGLARLLAEVDSSCDPYYVSSVNYPTDFVPGGGWYNCWQKNKETGKVEKSTLD